MSKNRLKSVGKFIVRKHTYDIAKLWLGIEAVSKQAKTLNQAEVLRVLNFISTRNHSIRNRALLMTTFLSGMRVGEVANLLYSDVVDASGLIKDEIRLRAEQTKGNEGRTVFINDKLRKELQIYADQYKPMNKDIKFFYSQKRNSNGFTPNTLTQFFHFLYKKAGVDGASSHSGRRTFITNLATKGVGVRVLMSLAGHKNISTTQAYIDINDDMKRRAVELA